MHNIWTDIVPVLREYTKTLEWKGNFYLAVELEDGADAHSPLANSLI